MKPEQLLWQLVKPFIPGHVERVENAASVGTPDVHFCFNGHASWLELKVAKKRGQEPKDMLDPEQKVWHVKHTGERGRVLVLVRDDMKLTLYRAVYESRIACHYTVVWTGIKPWNWFTFEAAIRSI